MIIIYVCVKKCEFVCKCVPLTLTDVELRFVGQHLIDSGHVVVLVVILG